MAQSVNYDFKPYDGSAELWEQFDEALRQHCAGLIDKSGSTLLLTIDDNDMGGGGPLAAPMPIVPGAPANLVANATADLRDMQRLRGTRNSLLYSVISKTYYKFGH